MSTELAASYQQNNWALSDKEFSQYWRSYVLCFHPCLSSLKLPLLSCIGHQHGVKEN